MINDSYTCVCTKDDVYVSPVRDNLEVPQLRKMITRQTAKEKNGKKGQKSNKDKKEVNADKEEKESKEDEEEVEEVKEEKMAVDCARFSVDGTYFAILYENKSLDIWNVTDAPWTKVKSIELARRANSLVFSLDEKIVYVGDKTGNVYSYDVNVEGEGFYCMFACLMRLYNMLVSSSMCGLDALGVCVLSLFEHV